MSCHKNGLDKTFKRHKWEFKIFKWQTPPGYITVQVKKCSQCGCYDFQWVDPQDQCPVCHKKFSEIKVKNHRKNPRMLMMLTKWDFPVCQECALQFLGEILKEAFTESLKSAPNK
jgi:hypothetical protein